jgi:hypothetical protein
MVPRCFPAIRQAGARWGVVCLNLNDAIESPHECPAGLTAVPWEPRSYISNLRHCDMVRERSGKPARNHVPNTRTSKVVRTGCPAFLPGDAAWCRPRAVRDEMPPPTDIPPSARRQSPGRRRNQTRIHPFAPVRPAAKVSPFRGRPVAHRTVRRVAINVPAARY